MLLCLLVSNISAATSINDTTANKFLESQKLNDEAEQSLLTIIRLIQNQQIEQALDQSRELVRKYPNFKLGKVIRDDLVYSQFNTLEQPFSSAVDDKQKHNLLAEANSRLDAFSFAGEKIKNKVPDLVKYIDASTAHFIIIDFSKSRLYLFRNDPKRKIPELITDHYVTIGKEGFNKQLRGDNRTPLGVYHITRFIDDQQLPELYGWGAFPINYPNAWDQKKQRTGSGIWLHGVPRNTYSRPPMDSRGCMVLSNNLLINLSHFLKINTPIILSNQIKWIDKSTYLQTKTQFTQLILAWKKSWETKNKRVYFNFYSKSFDNQNKNYRSWTKHKTNIFKRTGQISVKISQLNIFAYPGESNMAAVQFVQHYQGDRYISKDYKVQYWKKEVDGKWRIIDERSRPL